jgi:hypothetical protein
MKKNVDLWDVKLGFFDKLRQKRIIKRLLKTDKKYWIAIGHDLNGWIMPPQFYDLIPSWWNRNGGIARKSFVFIRPISEIIDSEFSRKEQLRFHNVFKGKMTDAEFEYWWQNTTINRENTLAYYDKAFFIEKVEWWKDDIFEAIKSALNSLEPGT